MAFDDPDLPMLGILPDPDRLKDCLAVTIRQPHSDLDSSLLLPAGWYRQPTSSDGLDFSNETNFASLALFTATQNCQPPIMFSIGVRPTPENGHVAEWLERQGHLQQLTFKKMKFNKFPFGWAVDASALLASELGNLKLRMTMFEDGGRLFILIGTAPIKIWDAWVAPLSLGLCSFELLHPKGQSTPLGPTFSREEPTPK